MVKNLLTKPNKSNSPNSQGVTPLMVALREGNTGIVDILLQEHEDVKALLEERDNDEKNVFHYALGSRKPAEVTQILVGAVSSNSQEGYSERMKDLLTAKDLNEDTPFHVLVQQQDLKRSELDNIFQSLSNVNESSPEPTLEEMLSERGIMSMSDILECMKEKNETKETPLHKAAKNGQTSFVEAVLALNSSSGVEHLLTEKDENANTALHLATQKGKTKHAKTKEVTRVLLQYIREHTKDAIRYLTKKNSFGWTPFSGAVAGGDLEMVEDMLRGLSDAEKRAVLSQPDYSNVFPLHLAAKYGHVGIFDLLVENKADITQRGRDQKTALDVAIEREQRAIIQKIIQGDNWKEAFRIPSTSDRGELDTPLRRLIRQMPDLAEDFMDRCYETGENSLDNKEVITMNADFIEDTHKYIVTKSKTRKEIKFRYDDRHDGGTPLEHFPEHDEKEYEVDINNHPMVIMADEKKLDLLQHPLCIAIILKKWSTYRWYYYSSLGFYLIFLLFLNLYAMTSPSPIDNPNLFTCTAFFEQYNSTEHRLRKGNSDWNIVFRWILLVINAARVLIFFIVEEYKPIINRLAGIQLKNFQASIRLIPFVFLLDFLVYLLATYIAIHNFSMVTTDGVTFFETDIRTCGQWQISAFTVTLAWLNLLSHMQMLYVVGKYIILFQDVLLTFMAVFVVVFILVMAFAAGFYMLLSNRENFDFMGDSLLKTMIMMSGEFEYGEIFFKELPPEGWGNDYDTGHEKVPFPFLTYTLFTAFFFLVSIVALNVLVGLTVDDIRKFLQDADLRKLSMRLRYILAMERWRQWTGEKKKTRLLQIKKHREIAVTNDLISKAKIWEKIEKKQEERRQKGEAEQEKQEMKEFVKEQHSNQTRRIQDLLQREHQSAENPEPNESKMGSIRRSTFILRQARSPGFEYDHDETHELLQRANSENKRLKAENKSLREVQTQKDAEIKRLQANSKSMIKMQNQKDVEIKRLQEDNKSLNEIKNDLKSIIQHLSSKEGKEPKSSPTNSGSILIQ